MRSFIKVLLMVLIWPLVIPCQTNSKIISVIEHVNSDSLYNFLEYISGEKLINSSFGTRYITSRYFASDGNIVAEEFLKNKLSQYFSATTTMQYFENGGGNIIAIQRGAVYPDKYVIICAHFDSMPSQGPAPGADDNGSGTAAVLEAARIFSNETPDCSIIYALWDNEEIGLKGSYYYAQQANIKKENIAAVINLDMIGWDSNNDFVAEVHTKNVGQSNKIAADMIKINSDYNIGLQLLNINPGTGSSDHASFWNFNFPAILLIENLYADKNIFYHQSLDRLGNINRIFYAKCTKAAIGTLAFYAGLNGATEVEEKIPFSFVLSQNYPNPFNSSTVINYAIDKEGEVNLTIHDCLGRKIKTLISEVQRPNNYSLKFDAGNLSSGIYFYILAVNGRQHVRKMILIK